MPHAQKRRQKLSEVIPTKKDTYRGVSIKGINAERDLAQVPRPRNRLPSTPTCFGGRAGVSVSRLHTTLIEVSLAAYAAWIQANGQTVSRCVP